MLPSLDGGSYGVLAPQVIWARPGQIHFIFPYTSSAMASKENTKDTPLGTELNFPSASLQQWLDKIESDLQGKKSLEELRHPTPEGISLEPAYHRENTRLNEQPLKEHPQWDLMTEILVEDEAEANREALQKLERGSTSLLFYLSGCTRLAPLLQNIELEYICLHLVTDSDPAALAEQLAKLIQERGLEPAELEGSLNFDTLENRARTGQPLQDQSGDFEALRQAARLLPSGYRPYALNINHFAHAGATLTQQLGLALAMAYEYIRRLELTETRGFWLHAATSGDYYGEIAKYRALRRLWAQLQDELELAPQELRLSAETGWRNHSVLDRYNSLIRSTTEAMSAIIGGVSELRVRPFDALLGKPSAFAERIALNQQHILQHESHFHQVRDLARGSYFLERYTEELAEKGWEFFIALENRGGYLEALRSGWLGQQIAAAAQAEQEQYDREDRIQVGANQYRNEEEQIPALDPARLRSPQAAPGTPYPVLPVRRLAEDLEQAILSGGE